MNQSFASLVLGLAHQAQTALDGQLPPEALAGGAGAAEIARALIDTLAMVEEKTKGNLEADEARLLAETLTALRFRFVQGGGAG